MTTSATIDYARPWRTHPWETAGMTALGLAAALALAGGVASPAGFGLGAGDARAATLPALPDVNAVRPVAPETALEINARLPFADGPNPAASPFNAASASAESRSRALECLTSAVYYEAGRESEAGQRAVAQVVLNRVRHPAFPASVCGVVYQGSTRATGCQFTFTCDGSLSRAPEAAAWDRARRVAAAALAGTVEPSVGNATHYHANYVAPYWAPTLAKTAAIGAHIFYRWSGGWGLPAAFTKRWSGRETDPNALRIAALSVPHPQPLNAVEAAAPSITRLAGVQVKDDGGRKVRVLFTPEARQAADKATHVEYVERVVASDNLRWTLGSGASAAPADKPFGKAPAATGGAAAATAAASTATAAAPAVAQ